MSSIPKYVGVCPLCGRTVSTLSDGVIRRNHRPDPKNLSSPICVSWGLRSTQFQKVEDEHQ